MGSSPIVPRSTEGDDAELIDREIWNRPERCKQALRVLRFSQEGNRNRGKCLAAQRFRNHRKGREAIGVIPHGQFVGCRAR